MTDNQQEVLLPKGGLKAIGKRHTLANLALAFAQISFGVSAVVGELGLPKTNPVFFAFVREAVAGPLLCCIAIILALRSSQSSLFPPTRLWWRFMICGTAIFMNQFCAITGIKVLGGVAMSVWQPTQPIFSLILSVFLGYEHLNAKKAIGILVAFGGVLFMVLWDTTGHKTSHEDSTSNNSSVGTIVGGNALFFTTCLSASVYVVASKPLLLEVPSVAVTGFSYVIGSVLMGIACVVVTCVPELLELVCPHNGENDDGCGSGWDLPPRAVWALAYWILFPSMCAYLLMTWGNRFVDASLVSAYTVLQPVSEITVATIVILTTTAPHFHLHGPNFGCIGILGIFAGLGVVVYDSRSRAIAQHKQTHLEGVVVVTMVHPHHVEDK